MDLTEDDLELVNKEFITDEFDTFESDVIYKINVCEQEIYLYFLQEMQSSNDFTMPFRLLVYMTLIWLDFFKNSDKNERKTKEFRFPPVIPLVLYNGRFSWTAKRHFKDIVSLIICCFIQKNKDKNVPRYNILKMGNIYDNMIRME